MSKTSVHPNLNVEKTNKSGNWASYLDLTFTTDKDQKISTKLHVYEKCDDVDFHIVNFPFLSSNIPSGPSHGLHILQLIRHARCCSYFHDFRHCHKNAS